jgi:menaquinone-dependent protoporphyrinogen oxidase
MSRILIAYSTVDGHTLKICSRIKQSLERGGHSATLLEIPLGAGIDLSPFDKIVIGASIRYGRHRRAVYSFIEDNRDELDRKSSAFFSVNVVARKSGKDTPDSNPYLKAFRQKTSWKPVEVAVFAGQIDYPHYRFIDRQIIRLIMWMTGGPTDPTARVEFTNWEAVETFSQRVSSMGASRAGPGDHLLTGTGTDRKSVV